ncbi:hypothetical protein M0534_13560 [Methylonatrum kenyense]|uniref:hypothetical protein n=1 Tax=Methylonatrum kenyense TaxID=455253 RepID=UPI0020BF43A2|nr:hypothetical protein [Methylonatrum kenyense]MCK8517343.1 hypothetical protein [Methylonatrum kenyense]
MQTETSNPSGRNTMMQTLKSWIGSFFRQFGALRSTLLGFTVLSILFATRPDQPIVYEGWGFVMTVVNPALMPLWLSGLLLDALMSKVVMGDADAAGRARLRLIIRVELILALVLVLAWTPFFMAIMA